jgi:haloacetate dehalogenase
MFDIPGTWDAWLKNMTAEAIPGGHFFPDQSGAATIAVLRGFLGSG